MFRRKKKKSAERTFAVRLICGNCSSGSDFRFPHGTELKRYRLGRGCVAMIPRGGGYRMETIRCPKCGSEKIA